MRAAGALLLLAFSAFAAPPLDDLRSFEPTKLPRELRERLDPGAELKAKQERLRERFRGYTAAVEALGAIDDAPSTNALCEVYDAATARAGRAEQERERALDAYRDCIVNYRPTMRRITWKPGQEEAGLRFHGNATVLREFGHALNGLREDCIGHLAKRQAPASLAYLEKALLKRGAPHLRAELAAMMKTPEPLLAALKRERDEGVRAALLTALGRLEAAKPHAALVAKHVSDKSERVRIAAARALAELHVFEGIDPLIRRLGKETGLARSVMARALESLTGQRFGPFEDAWQKWWARAEGKLREEGLPPPGEPPAAKADAHFYGVPQVSEHILYVIDISDSMRAAVGGKTRLDACKEELTRAIRALPKTASFNVILYNHGVQAWRGGMTAADPGARDDAARFVRLTVPHGTTNILDALGEAFRIAGETYVDTIYLLTDGSPTDDNGFPEDALKILRAVRRWNTLGRVTIHTIGIGKDLNRPFLERLAKDNGGEFIQKE